MGLGAATVLIGGETFEATPEVPFVFGRADGDGIVGLDATDMGISARAGSVEAAWGVWWVVNQSAKRRLLIDDGLGGPAHHLEPSHRHAVNVAPLTVLVPGEIYTHRLEVMVPDADLALVRAATGATSGTFTSGDIVLTERDREALSGLFGGYLEEFPRRQDHPRTYQEAADLLGGTWTKTVLRKHVERIKARLQRHGLYFDGPRGNYELADFVIANRLLTSADLVRFERRTPPETDA